MLIYILKRLLLMIPTLLGIMLMTFTVIQFVPGGPIEQVIEVMSTTEDFKMNNNLVIIDFLLRHGYVGPDDPHYAVIAQRLRSPVTW